VGELYTSRVIARPHPDTETVVDQAVTRT
jgi:microcompartment protein CcmL/EutN